MDKYAWYSAYGTHPVGTKKPNGLGLHDMSGNVWEWVGDRYDAKYYKSSPKDNPKGPSSGEDRVLRGGCWDDASVTIRATSRLPAFLGDFIDINGFRLARSAE